MAAKTNLVSRIREHGTNLSPTLTQVASYILERPDEVAFDTASELARRIGVSESTIVRFAMALGYSGYPKMQADAQQMVRHKLSTVNRLMSSEAAQLSGESIYRKVMMVDMENIRLTIDNLRFAPLDEVVDAILQSRRVIVAGFRITYSLALFFFYALNLVRSGVQVVDLLFPLEQLHDVGPEDLVIGITLKRYTQQTVEVMQFAKERQAKTIALTDTPLSPISGLADWTLYARNDLPSYVDSFVASLSVINAVVTAVGLKQGDALERLQELERIWEQYGVFSPETLDAARHDS